MTALDVPPGLQAALEQLVRDYADLHREPADDVRRAVEIAVLQRGIRALADDVAENKALSRRMGWTG